MKALFVSDLDGTLLGRDSRLSPYGLRTLNELIAQGLPFTYATARSLSSARLVTKGLAVRCPVVTNNGVFIRDSEKMCIRDRYSTRFRRCGNPHKPCKMQSAQYFSRFAVQ